MTLSEMVHQICPPVLLSGLSKVRHRLKRTSRALSSRAVPPGGSPLEQDLDLYWDEDFAQKLETWGDGTSWREIEYLLANVEGPVLDIACGTGKVSEMLTRFPALELYGCDISDLLISKAHARGLPAGRFIVCDATKTPYDDKQFSYGYSIGSLEHFTEPGIRAFIVECRRVISIASFHHIPTARDGRDHGWITTTQSYFNNSREWWLSRFRDDFPDVYTLDSAWSDRLSLGTWIVCPSPKPTRPNA